MTWLILEIIYKSWKCHKHKKNSFSQWFGLLPPFSWASWQNKYPFIDICTYLVRKWRVDAMISGKKVKEKVKSDIIFKVHYLKNKINYI